VKAGMLCVLLLSGCLSSDDSPTVYEYALTWTCLSSAGCERMEEVARIDRMEEVRRDCRFTSTRDESFGANAQRIVSDFLPPGCSWVYFLSLFGHELERSRICFLPGGFELDLSIPNEDPATQSLWLVEGRDLDLL
jgi:hypothetical protein